MAAIGGTSGLAGCSESSHSIEELDSFATHNYQSIPAGECYIQPVSGSYTGEFEYYVNLNRPDEGYANDSEVHALVFPEYIVPGEQIRELPQDLLSDYLEEPSLLDIDENTDGAGTVPPGWNTFVIDNSRGETSVEAEIGGTLYRSKEQLKTDSCGTTGEGIDIPKLDFVRSYAGTPSRLLFHFRIDSPLSNSYEWRVTVLTQTAQTTRSWNLDAECSAHLAGDWEIEDEDLNDFDEHGGRLKVEVTAEGADDEYQAEEWLNL